jgi:hypothetical protein
MFLSGGRGVVKPQQDDRNGLWLLPEESSLDMRRCLPGLSAGLAAMCAVIANRLLRGLLSLIRLH